MTNDLLIANPLNQDLAVFRARFWRSYRLLYFVACRVLDGLERTDDAIENCWLKASRNPPHFEYEGAFRSWLVRVLIDEALLILDENQELLRRSPPPNQISARDLRLDYGPCPEFGD